MGCNIHAYIDFDKQLKDGDVYVTGLGEIYLLRQYGMFGLMAGGLRWPEVKDIAFQPRGLPDNISWITRDGYSLYVSDDDGADGFEGVCSRDKALGWVQAGYSEWTSEHQTHITHPDWHTASWLTAEELEKCIGLFEGYFHETPSIEYYAVLAAMKALDERGYAARLVFWFDN